MSISITYDDLSQLEYYYRVCNFDGRVTCGSLIKGCLDILNGHPTTVDAHNSTPEELAERIAYFYNHIERYV